MEHIMHLNHPQTIPLPHLWEKCLLWNQPLMQKRLGIEILQGSDLNSSQWPPTPVFLPRLSGGLLSIGSHRVRHDWNDLACMHALEKEMATHSSVLAWRIPGSEEPGGLPSMGSHRVGHDWSDLACMCAKVLVLGSLEVNDLLPDTLSMCGGWSITTHAQHLNFHFWV